MQIVYSDHAIKRMKQRGIIELEIEQVLKFPMYVKKTFNDRKEAFGEVNNREILVEFIETETYIKIITIM